MSLKWLAFKKSFTYRNMETVKMCSLLKPNKRLTTSCDEMGISTFVLFCGLNLYEGNFYVTKLSITILIKAIFKSFYI